MMKYFILVLSIVFLIGWYFIQNRNHDISAFTLQQESESICLLEIKKKTLDFNILKKHCGVAAEGYQKQKKYNKASWYYLLSKQYKLVMRNKKVIDSYAYINVAHSYMLDGNTSEARVFYTKFLKNFFVIQADKTMKEDYSLLLKVYPNKKRHFRQSLFLWEDISNPLERVKDVYIKYAKFNKSQDYAQAIRSMVNIIFFQEESKLQNREVILESEFKLAILYYKNKEYDLALDNLNILERKFKSNLNKLNRYVSLLNWKAKCYRGLKKYKKSIEYYKRIIAFKEKKLGKTNKILAKYYDEVASLFQILKEYDEALKFYSKALEIREKINENRLGVIPKSKEEVFSIENILFAEKQKKQKNRLIGLSHQNIGLLYLLKKDYKKALENYEKALSLIENNSENNNYSIAHIYMGIGTTYQAQKHYGKSLEYHQKALLIKESFLGKQNKLTSINYQKIGKVYNSLGDYDNAYKYLNISLQIFLANQDDSFKNILDKNDKRYLDYQNHINGLLEVSEKYIDFNQSKAKLIKQNIFSQWLDYQSFVYDSEHSIATMYSHSRCPDPREEDIDSATVLNKINSKKKWLNEYTGNNILSTLNTIVHVPKTRKNIHKFIFDKNKLLNLYQSIPSFEEKKSWIKKVKYMRKKIDEFYNEKILSNTKYLKRYLRNFYVIKDVQFKDIAKNLKENELYIDYLRTDNHYYIFTLDKRKNITFKQLNKNSSDTIDNLVMLFHKDLTTILYQKNISKDSFQKLVKSSKNRLKKLYKLVIQNPIGKEVKNKKSFIISSTGMLNSLPIEILFEKTNNRFLYSSLIAKDVSIMLDTFGHRGVISDLIVTKDGDIISASHDKTIRIWDKRTGKEKRKILGQIGKGHEGEIYTIALSPNERYLAVGGYLGSYTNKKPREEEEAHKIRIYNYQTGKMVKLLKSHTNVINDLTFTKNGKYLLSASSDGTVKIWDINKKFLLVNTVQESKSAVISLKSFQKKNENLIISLDLNGSIMKYNIENQKVIKKIQTMNKLYAIAISTKYIAISKDKELAIYDYDLNRIQTIKLKSKVLALAYSPNGRYLVGSSGNYPYELTLYDSQTKYQNIKSFKKHNGVVRAIDFIDNSTVVSGGGDEYKIYLWDSHNLKVKKELSGGGNKIWSVGLSWSRVYWGNKLTHTNGTSILNNYFTLKYNSSLEDIPNLTSQKPTYISTKYRNYSLSKIKYSMLEINEGNQTIASIKRDKYSGYGHTCYGFYRNYIISGGENGILKIYDFYGKEVANLVGHKGTIRSISLDGDRLISGGDDQIIRIWDLSILNKNKFVKSNFFTKNWKQFILKYYPEIDIKNPSDIKKLYKLLLKDYGIKEANKLKISQELEAKFFVFINNKMDKWIIWNDKGDFLGSSKLAKNLYFYINQGVDKEAKMISLEEFQEDFIKKHFYELEEANKKNRLSTGLYLSNYFNHVDGKYLHNIKCNKEDYNFKVYEMYMKKAMDTIDEVSLNQTLENYLKALKIARKIFVHTDMEIIDLYYKIAYVYKIRKEYRKALDFYNELFFYYNDDSSGYRALVFSNMAETYFLENKLNPKAIEFYQKALKIWTMLDKNNYIIYYDELLNVYRKLTRLYENLSIYQKYNSYDNRKKTNKERAKEYRKKALILEAKLLEANGRTDLSRDELEKRAKKYKVLKPFVQSGHSSVTSLAITSDNKYLVSGGIEKSIRIWDISSEKLLRIIRTDMVSEIKITSDNKYIISAENKNIVIRDIRTGKVIKNFKVNENGIASFALSKDGKNIFAGGVDGTVNILDIKNDKIGKAVQYHNTINSFKFSANNRYLISISSSEIIIVDNYNKKSSFKNIYLKDSFGWDIAITPDSKYMISEGNKTVLNFWDIKNKTIVKTFKSSCHSGSLAISPNGKYLLVGEFGGEMVNVYDINTTKKIQNFKTGHRWINILIITNDSEYVYTGGSNGEINLWHIKSGKKLKTFNGSINKIGIFNFYQKNTEMILKMGNNDIILWDLKNLKESKTIKSLDRKGISNIENWIHFSDISKDNKYAVIKDYSSSKLIDIVSGKTIYKIKENIDAIAISPNHKYFLTSNHKVIKLWDIKTKKVIRTFKGHKYNVRVLKITPNNLYIISGGGDGEVKIWNLENGKLIKTFRVYAGSITSLDVSKDNSLLVISSEGFLRRDVKTILLLDLSTQKKIYTDIGYEGNIQKIAFSKDGKNIIFINEDGIMKIWNISLNRELISLINFKDGNWIIMTPEGYFKGSQEVLKYINLTRYTPKGMKPFDSSQLYDHFFRPDLVKVKLSGEERKYQETIQGIIYKTALQNPPPTIKIKKINKQTKKEKIKLSFNIKDNNGGIGLIRIYHEGKLIQTIGDGKVNKQSANIDTILEQEEDDKKNKKNQTDEKMNELLAKAKNGTLDINDTIANQKIITTINQAGEYEIELELISGKNEIGIEAFNKTNTVASYRETIVIDADIPKKKAKLYAIVVGIDNFKSKPKKYHLNYAEKDALSIQKEIENKIGKTFDEVEVKSLIGQDVTRANILKSAKEIAQKAKLEDTIIFYISTHGRAVKGNLYFAPYNNAQGRDWIDFQQTFKAIQSIKALNQVFIVDACESGQANEIVSAVYDSRASILARSAGVHMLLATTKGAYAFEPKDKSKNAMTFTQRILKTLRDKESDKDGDGFVSVVELSKSLKEAKNIVEYQYPVIRNVGGDVRLRRVD